MPRGIVGVSRWMGGRAKARTDGNYRRIALRRQWRPGIGKSAVTRISKGRNAPSLRRISSAQRLKIGWRRPRN